MLRGLVIALLLGGNLLLVGVPVSLFGLLKPVMRGRARGLLIRFIAWMGERWVGQNNRILDAFLDTVWDVEGPDDADRDGHYLILSNHLSWVDIFVAFRVFHRRTALVRFFLKDTLRWAPIVGQAAMALDFPFMRRYSKEYLEQHPEKRGRDLETTRKSCSRFRHVPVAILNYVEGTRFTRAKHAEQQSPYRYLLRPRVGGVAFVLASLGDQLDGVYDLTVVYPGHQITMWDFATNRVPRIVVRVRRIDPPRELYTTAITEPGPVREHFKQWIDARWREKDTVIGGIVETESIPAAGRDLR
ncbi:MAG TPA: acetyltransferase [Thermoanaerobaculia bacterium]